MIVRRCNSEDFEKIYRIEELAFPDPFKRETIQGDLKKENSYYYGLFDDDLVAFISYEKVIDEAQIISVAVHPMQRRKGYAKTLFNEVCREAKTCGIEFFTLEVRENNTPAIALYKSLGFGVVGRRKNYYQNPLCDAILMDLKV